LTTNICSFMVAHRKRAFAASGASRANTVILTMIRAVIGQVAACEEKRTANSDLTFTMTLLIRRPATCTSRILRPAGFVDRKRSSARLRKREFCGQKNGAAH